ncbi:TonB-dependent siderophore receptor [Paroceanicella profunda]|uniref:TonB-dependent siderophore receptor n=1 Tax=Paroceanicella profunda TaxID=2579971 RepID=A0A5B8FH10_9RHOB|nr:TonB-dependent siderophore receptor [Paroceanicella profunda]QDL91468.1 TonB-dependent siderophore receptor [Paroceanicella profunda]
MSEPVSGRTGLLGGACIAAILTASAASAQSAGEVIPLEPVVVESEALQDPTAPVTGYVAETTATATKTGTPILETQQSVSVVTAGEIRAQGAQTLGQALEYTAGVVGAPYGSDARFDSPVLRGFDGRQSQYLNGLKLMRTSGAPAIETYGMERVEVLLGPSSLLYGQGNPGGIINQIQKHPQFRSFGEVGAGLGSYDTREIFGDVGNTLGDGEVAWRLTGVLRQADMQTDELDNDRYYIAPTVTWKPSARTSFTLLSSLQQDNPSSPSGLPAELTLDGGNQLSRDFYIGETSVDTSDRTMANIGYEFEHRFNDSWTFSQNFRYSDFTWDYDSVYFSSLAADGRTMNRGVTYQQEDTGTLNLDSHLIGAVSLGETEHTLLFGVDLRQFDNDTVTEFGRAPTLDALDPQYGAAVPRDVWYTSTNDTRLRQAGIYVQDEAKWGGWRATGGLRYDWAKSEGTTYTNFAGSSTLDEQDSALTGRAGLSYIFDNGIAPYVSYSTSFEPVSGTDGLTGAAFEPTTGEQFEIGVKYQPVGMNAMFTAALYDLTQENVTVTDTYQGASYSRQVGKVHSQGLELQGTASLMEGLDLHAAYTYTDAEREGGLEDGLRPTNVPKNAASLWLNYTFDTGALKGLGLGGGVRYVGSRYGDLDNAYRMDSVTLFDLGVTYDLGDVLASVTVRNLTDETYVSNCGSFGCYYGDGRTVMARLTYKW